ncbi:MAG: hypothetical protein EB117_14620, partial [Betaproteobacteria bacterium]|nr:hypothetical protein [Betaproteobacteria bacterium]
MPDGIDAIVKKLGEAKYRYGDVVKTNNGNEVVITGYEVDDSYPYLGKTVDGEFEYFCDEEIGEVLKPSPYFPQHADTPNPATKEPTQFKVNDRVVTLKRLGLLEADLVGIVVAVRATGLEVSFEDGTMGFYLNNELDAYLRPAKERSVIADDSDEDDENKKAESLDPTAEEAQQYFRNVKRTQLDWMEWEFLSGKGLAAKGIRHNYFIHPSCSLHIGSEYICSIRVKTEVK